MRSLTVAPVDAARVCPVSQIVEAEVIHADLPPCPLEGLPYGITPHWATVAADEEPLVACPHPQMLFENRQHVRWDSYRSAPSIGLGVRVKCDR
jgi:hypothetical protein